jgi:hypothetical protein
MPAARRVRTIMKERPILFNGDMVRAILDDRKTQTRRVMKIQPSANFSPMNMALELDYNARWYTPGVVDKDGYLQPAKKLVFGVADEDEGYACPLGAVGDRVWVRETFRLFDKYQECGCSDFPCNCPSHNTPIYRASNDDHESKWTPSLHMPRSACRMVLEITDARVERLNCISEEDALSEGVLTDEMRPDEHDYTHNLKLCPKCSGTGLHNGIGASGGVIFDIDCAECNTAAKRFKWLWQSIYGEENWAENPWVWVIEFKRVEVGV